MRPSEYFDRNCSIGASNTRRRELARRYEIGVGNIMWGNDFPHPEGTWPHTKEWLRNAFSDIPEIETQAILGTNAAKIYDFDAAALAPLVDRIGPTPAELGQTGAETDGRLDKWADGARGRSSVDHRHRGHRGPDRVTPRFASYASCSGDAAGGCTGPSRRSTISARKSPSGRSIP